MQRGFVVTLILLAVIAVILLSVYWEDQWKIDLYSKIIPASVCKVGLLIAENPQSGECRQFATSCEIPKGWVVVENCF